MKYISVCSGIEAATVAWHELGFEPVAFSEIEKFPSAVLSHHYPEVPNWGDMTKFKEWPDATIDLLVGGTPCQSFSVAGLRKGLDDPRGNLMLTYLAIADRYRPKWIVWENVPGVLSSNRGRDFGTFLGALGELGYGWSYRVLDAQYFGVAQRRRRVFVVGCLGDWRSAAAVLLERESMSGNPPPSRKARKDLASGIGSGVKEVSQSVEQKSIEVVGSLDTECGGTKLNHQTAQNGHFVCASRMVAFGEYVNDETASAMKARDWKDATDLISIEVSQTPTSFKETADCLTAGYGTKWNGNASAFNGSLFVNHPSNSNDNQIVENKNQPIALAENTIGRQPLNGGNGDGFTVGGPMYTLNATGVHGVAQPIAFAQNTRDEVRLIGGDGQVVGALAAQPGMKQTSYVAQPIPIDLRNANRDPEKHDEINRQGVGVGEDGDPSHTLTTACVHGVAQLTVAPTLTASNDPSRSPQSTEITNQVAAIHKAIMAVRRLTPVECERLQGFPDGYTDIRSNGTPDGHRYKSLGNSMAVPVMKWIGQRIKKVEEIKKSINQGERNE